MGISTYLTDFYTFGHRSPFDSKTSHALNQRILRADCLVSVLLLNLLQPVTLQFPRCNRHYCQLLMSVISQLLEYHSIVALFWA